MDKGFVYVRWYEDQPPITAHYADSATAVRFAKADDANPNLSGWTKAEVYAPDGKVVWSNG